jgi:NADPH-dependent F420 reductase
MSEKTPLIAIIGGTGALGGGLARRWARAGRDVIIGSRSSLKAEEAAAALRTELGARAVRGMSNADAAAVADIIVLAVPFQTHEAILDEIAAAAAGKVVVDTTVPLVPPKVSRVQLPLQGSAALMTQARLGQGAVVLSAFHNVSAQKLAKDEDLDCDILVFGDDKAARQRLIEEIAGIGVRGLHGGPLCNSAAAEAMTSVLIHINRQYGVSSGAGIRITGSLGEARMDV